MTRKQKKKLVRIILSAALLAIASFLELELYLRLAVFLVPYLIIGYDTLLGAARNIIRGQMFDEKLLMSIATVGALVLGEYTEAVAVMLFYRVGELFESIAVGKSRRSIASLMDIRPDVAVVLRDGVRCEVECREVNIGEIIEVLPGERIPLDGIVLQGQSTLDTSALTGESLPRDIGQGERAVSGVVNLTGVLRIEVESLFADSTVSRILELVESSAEKKSRTENFITRFARWYTPCVVFAALGIAFIPPIFLGELAKWISRALIFLVVSCPCALVISVPLSFFGGIGGASRRGILIKGASYLEALAGADTFVFDKTGTLTRGSFEVRSVSPCASADADELLRLAASIESYSIHPIAKAVVRAYEEEKALYECGSVCEIAGKGIEAEVGGKLCLCGNASLMRERGIDLAETDGLGTAVHIAREGEYLGFIELSDCIKNDASEAISSLKALGIKQTYMLTGDRREIAQSVAKELGIDKAYSELLPQDKAEILDKLLEGQAKGKKGRLVYIGDGINDAPVLARADVGISMGAMGSDAAIEASDIVLMDDGISKLPSALKIAKRTLNIARQNIIFALAVKIGVMLLGALGYADMWAAVFADVGVSVIAILNAMRTLSVKQ